MTTVTDQTADITVTKNADGSISWEWRGEGRNVLVSRELMDDMLRQLNDYYQRVPESERLVI